jgi:hypothetical protein
MCSWDSVVLLSMSFLLSIPSNFTHQTQFQERDQTCLDHIESPMSAQRGKKFNRTLQSPTINHHEHCLMFGFSDCSQSKCGVKCLAVCGIVLSSLGNASILDTTVS